MIDGATLTEGLGDRLGMILGRFTVTEGTVLGATLTTVGGALVVGRGDTDGNSDGNPVVDGAVLGAELGTAIGNFETTDGAVLGAKLVSVGFWLDVGAAERDGMIDGATLTEGLGDRLGRTLGRFDRTEATVLGATLVLVGCTLVVGRCDTDGNPDGNPVVEGALLGCRPGTELGNFDTREGAVLGAKFTPVGFWLVVGATDRDGLIDGATLAEGLGDGLGVTLGRFDRTEDTGLGAALVPVGCALVVGRGDIDGTSVGDTVNDGALLGGTALGNFEAIDGGVLGAFVFPVGG